MTLKINIPLRLPDARHPDRCFSFRLQTWLQAPPPYVYTSSAKLFVVSDIKEHFRSFHKLLIKHRIIDRHLQWIFDEGHLVVMGNSFDEKEIATEHLWFLYDLEQKARLQGGYVHFILGSHEIKHINGKWRKEHPPYPSATAKVRSPITALYDANFELRRWLGARNIVERIGNLLLVHGDVFPILYSGYHSIGDINTFARSVYKYLTEASTGELSEVLFSGGGFYPHSVNLGESSTTKEQVDGLLKKFNVDTIITSHAAQEQVTTSFDGKLVNIPINHATGNPVGLLIKQQKFLHADRQGRQEKINF